MLTTKTPETWQDLQGDAAQVLIECGMRVEVEKKIEGVRGSAKIDVYAVEMIDGRRYSILCECKHWKSAVPQSVVHSVRTVVSDVGANTGYIISTNGFQSGALTAARSTNIELVTWPAFLTAFEKTWLTRYFAPTIAREFDGLMSLTEPFAPRIFSGLSDADGAAYAALYDEHAGLGWLALSLSTPARIMEGRPFPALPLRTSLKPESAHRLPANILDAMGYRELMSEMLRIGLDAVSRFHGIKRRAIAT